MAKKGKKNTQGKGQVKFIATAKAMAGRLATSRHQRRKMEKLAKRHPQEFMEASRKYDKER